MKKSMILFAAISASMIIASCSLLDVENTSQIYGSSYWNSPSEVKSYLTGTYTQFRSTMNTLEYFESRSDEFVAGLEGGTTDAWAQNLSSTNGKSWGDFYKVIQHCNMIIKNAENVRFELASEKNDLLAQTYVLRSYCYFCLIRLWGDVPLELKPTEGSTKEKLARSSAADVMEQALTDTRTAISMFSSDWGSGKSFATKRAAQALMADMLLWKVKVLGGDASLYDDVITYATDAMEGTSLEEDFAQIFSTRNGSEIIWSIHFGYPEASAQYGYLLKPRDIFVTKAVNVDKIAYAKSGARSRYAPSDKIINLLSFYPGDVRKDNSYIVAVDSDANVLGTFDNKMRGTETETNFIYDNDIIIYRTAEMILFKAEALAAKGLYDDAVTELNRIRSRARIPVYSGARDRISIEHELLSERGREFWLEGKRWPDLLRFHFEGAIDVYQEVPNLLSKSLNGIDIPLYYAIPVSELSLNHKLTQTAGYETL